jgi:hypothetical protein
VAEVLAEPKQETASAPDPMPEFKPHRYINGWVSTEEEERQIWEYCQGVHQWFNKKYGGGKW